MITARDCLIKFLSKELMDLSHSLMLDSIFGIFVGSPSSLSEFPWWIQFSFVCSTFKQNLFHQKTFCFCLPPPIFRPSVVSVILEKEYVFGLLFRVWFGKVKHNYQDHDSPIRFFFQVPKNMYVRSKVGHLTCNGPPFVDPTAVYSMELDHCLALE